MSFDRFSSLPVIREERQEGSQLPARQVRSDPPRPQALLFVVDRSMDPVAPFLHEFTYQAMVNDLLPIEDGKTYKCARLSPPALLRPSSLALTGGAPPSRYEFQASAGNYEQMASDLSEKDSVWTEVRHMHMRDAIDKLMGDFNAFMKEHGGFSAKSVHSTGLSWPLLSPKATRTGTMAHRGDL